MVLRSTRNTKIGASLGGDMVELIWLVDIVGFALICCALWRFERHNP